MVSIGYKGEFTARHSMRLVNVRFAEEERFFWDENGNIVICPVVKADEIFVSDFSKTFPIPFNDQIVVQNKDDLVSEVIIYNLEGKQVFCTLQFFFDRIQIQTDHLPNGIYLINGLDRTGMLLFSKKKMKRKAKTS